MGISERKEREKSEMRELILETALKLFVDKGYDNVSIRKIADVIEYSPGTIYLYFKDKDEIFFELHNQGFVKFYGHQMSIQGIPDVSDRLTAHGRAYLQFAIENWPNNELIGNKVILPPPKDTKGMESRMKNAEGYDWWFSYKSGE